MSWQEGKRGSLYIHFYYPCASYVLSSTILPDTDLRRKYQVPSHRDCGLPRTHQNTEWQDVPGTSLTPRKWCILDFQGCLRTSEYSISPLFSRLSWNRWSLRLFWMIIQWNNHQHYRHRPLLGIFLQNGVICWIVTEYLIITCPYSRQRRPPSLNSPRESEKNGESYPIRRYMHNGSVMHIAF